MRTRPRPLIAAAATVLGALALTACGSGLGTTGDDGRVAVVASFYPMEFLVEQIGGDHVSVTTLTEPGVEPHDLELSPRQTGQLGEADVVVYLKGLQPAVDQAVDQSGVRHIAEAASFTDHAADPGADDHGDSDGHGEEHGGDHGGDGHEHGSGDPHVWLDPLAYAEIAEGVGSTLRKADPDHAADYRKNTEALVGKLKELDKEFRDGLAGARNHTFVTNHAAFGHLAGRYGLTQEAIAGLDPESEPSAARMKDLHGVVREEKVTTVFFETLADGDTARTLADDLGLTTDVLDPVEGISDASEGDDYFEVMRANLAALRKALDAQ